MLTAKILKNTKCVGTIAATLREVRSMVDVQSAGRIRDLDGYRAVVIGAPLYLFNWLKEARNFVARRRVIGNDHRLVGCGWACPRRDRAGPRRPLRSLTPLDGRGVKIEPRGSS
jgi:hypothetical protein